MLAALLCGAALLASGCGSDNEGKGIPKSAVADLEASLNSIQRRFELGDGACRDIFEGSDTDVQAVQKKIDALPSDVDKDVKSALQDSFNNLFDMVQQECKQTDTNTETTPTVTESTPTAPAPAPTETTPTETTPPQTNTAPDKKKDKGPGNGDDKGQGKDKGNKDTNGGGGTQAPQAGN